MPVAKEFLKIGAGVVDQTEMKASCSYRTTPGPVTTSGPVLSNSVWLLRSLHQAACVLLVVACFASTGCLALGIPSQRLHDPDDQGGILGDWKRSNARTPAEITAELVAEGAVIRCADGACSGVTHPGHFDESCLGGLPALDVDPITGGGPGTEEEPPEVPWPKYHPLPTRPVFGSPYPS